MTPQTPFSITPVAKGHAIEVMALAVEFSTPLGTQDITKVGDVYDGSIELKEFLPVKKPIEQIQFEVSTDNKQPSFSTRAGAGLELSKSPDSNGQLAWSLAVMPQLITCQCRSYDRWRNVKPLFLSVLEPILNAVLTADRGIKTLGLQYEDAFVITGDLSKFRAEAAFKPSSKWIPTAVFDHQSLWHVHQGWFAADPEDRRVLNILNINLVEEGASYRLRINGQHRMLSLDMNGKPLPHHPSDLACAFDHMHGESTSLLKDILSFEMLKSIGMIC